MTAFDRSARRPAGNRDSAHPARPTAGRTPVPGVGNHALQRLLRANGIQAKLTVNEPGDAYEQEADRVADRVMRMPDPGAAGASDALAPRPSGAVRSPVYSVNEIPAPPGIQRACARCDDDETRGGDLPIIQRMCASCAATHEEDAEGEAPGIQRACAQCEEELHRAPADEQEEEGPRVAGASGILGIQRAGAGPRDEDEEDATILTKRAGPARVRGGDAVPGDVGAAIRAARARGNPLPSGVRAFMEPRLGADLSRVRIHADATSTRLADRLSARAFTLGRDVFFHASQYDPSSFAGRRLLAHELVHTVQQGAAPRVRRTPSITGDAPPPVSRGAFPAIQRASFTPRCVRHLAETRTGAVCDPPPAAHRVGSLVHSELQSRYRVASNRLTEVLVPYGNKAPCDVFDPTEPLSSKGRADLVRVVKRNKRAVRIEIAEIKPLNATGLAAGVHDVFNCYAPKIREAGPNCVAPTNPLDVTFCRALGAVGRRVELTTRVGLTWNPGRFVMNIGGRPRRMYATTCAPGVIGYRCLDEDDKKKKKKGKKEGKKKGQRAKAKPKKKPAAPKKAPKPAAKVGAKAAKRGAGRAALKGAAKKLIPGEAYVEAGMLIALLAAGAKPAFGAEGKSTEEAFLDLLIHGAPPDVEISPALQELLDANPDLKSRLEDAAKRGDVPKEELEALANETMRLLEANKDLLDEETLEKIITVMESSGGTPGAAPDPETFRQQLEAIKRGEVPAPGGKDGGEPTPETPPGPGKPEAEGTPAHPELAPETRKKLDAAPAPVQDLYKAVVSKEGEGPLVTDASVERFLEITKGLTEDEADALKKLVQPPTGGQSADQFLDGLEKAIGRIRGGEKTTEGEASPPVDVDKLFKGLDFSAVEVGAARVWCPGGWKAAVGTEAPARFYGRMQSGGGTVINVAASVRVRVIAATDVNVTFEIVGASPLLTQNGTRVLPASALTGLGVQTWSY